MFRLIWKSFFAAMLFACLSIAPAWAGDVTVKLQANYTVTTGQVKISIPQSWMEAGHVYTATTAPVSGNISAYGDPSILTVFYKEGSTKRAIYWRHDGDRGEHAEISEEMWKPGENRAEFWIICEVASCSVRLTVYEREDGTFDRKTFYREGIEPGVIDGQFSLYKDFYHSIKKNGSYGLQVDYEADRYLYLYREDNFSTSGANALSFSVRSSGSIDEDDLTIALTTGNHSLLTSWKPLSDYVTIAASHTWYQVLIPLSDLNPSESSIRGLALMSSRSGLVYLDDVRFTSDESVFKLRLPLKDYTPFTIPVSAIMDNSIGSGLEGIITTYNNQEGRFNNGCKEYLRTGNYIDCSGTVSDYDLSDHILAARGESPGGHLLKRGSAACKILGNWRRCVDGDGKASEAGAGNVVGTHCTVGTGSWSSLLQAS